jgi:diazepam-binding inhibitor (GABA receptor modulating acyl-CoA-binding protein)
VQSAKAKASGWGQIPILQARLWLRYRAVTRIHSDFQPHRRPDNATLLKIYALYKQGSTGDNTDKKPGFGDMVARAKWDAWNSLKGTSQEDAMQQYVDLIESLS